MEKISDTITTVFHIAIKDKRPAVCLSRDGDTVWSDIFGLGWRFGIRFNPGGWFAKVHFYLDHNQTQTEQDQAIATIQLRDGTDKDARGLKERVTTITEFGHGQPALLGSWSPSELALHPYVSFTLTTKARFPQFATTPLPSPSRALTKSLESGDFVDTKFYVFSRRSGSTARKPRVVYANSSSIGLALPKLTSGADGTHRITTWAYTITGARQANGSAPAFLVSMVSDQHIDINDSVLYDYEYEQDSDLEDEGENEENSTGRQSNPVPGRRQTGSSSEPQSPGNNSDEGFPPFPPTYSVSTSRIILVKDIAYKTWLSYIYYRYTGQVSFRPLKSARDSSSRCPRDPSQPPYCSPKSIYRVAVALEDERMKELAFRAIKEGLTKDNIVDEVFSWFTAQYRIIKDYEVKKVLELRKLPEVSSALRLQMKAVSAGEKPWAYDVLVAIIEGLNSSEPST